MESSVKINTKRLFNVGLMLEQRLRCWPNIKPTSAACFMLAVVVFKHE